MSSETSDSTIEEHARRSSQCSNVAVQKLDVSEPTFDETDFTKELEEYARNTQYVDGRPLDIQDPDVRSWFKVKRNYDRLVRENCLIDLKPGTWVLCNEKALLDTSLTKRKLVLNRPRGAYIFRYGVATSGVSKSISSTSPEPESDRQWVRVQVQKRETNDFTHDVDLLVGRVNVLFAHFL
eukprot:TRINITY_DN799_c0_g1_i1.p1 TRINITY_DN799_c0_g1~~TRINITY_DN799_c0_g1_i1.p1  ORF type:complete len:181 (+),score=20.04 TRINITY_DN799_c0_g1_i1:25-567(+)